MQGRACACWVALLLLVAPWCVQSDFDAPRLVSLSAAETVADVRLLPDWRECTPERCGATATCADLSCRTRVNVNVKAQDLPDAAATGAKPAGIRSVSVRFASPEAVRRKLEASHIRDEQIIDPTLFKVGRMDFTAEQGVGRQTDPASLEVPVYFDGYAEPGVWQLDSVALIDNEDNAAMFRHDEPPLKNIAASVVVSSLQLSVCAGTCSGKDVTCRQFGSATQDGSRTYRQRVWWRCESAGSAPEHTGACCASCAASQAHGLATPNTAVSPPDAAQLRCEAPLQHLAMSPCGCASGPVGNGWSCKAFDATGLLGDAKVCSAGAVQGGSEGRADCSRNGSIALINASCAASGQQLLVSRPPAPMPPTPSGTLGGGVAGSSSGQGALGGAAPVDSAFSIVFASVLQYGTDEFDAEKQMLYRAAVATAARTAVEKVAILSVGDAGQSTARRVAGFRVENHGRRSAVRAGTRNRGGVRDLRRSTSVKVATKIHAHDAADLAALTEVVGRGRGWAEKMNAELAERGLSAATVLWEGGDATAGERGVGGSTEEGVASSASTAATGGWTFGSDSTGTIMGIGCVAGAGVVTLALFFWQRLRKLTVGRRVGGVGRDLRGADTAMNSVTPGGEEGRWHAGQGRWTAMDSPTSRERARARAELGESLNVDASSLGGAALRSGVAGAADLGLTRAEAVARLREMGFGPIDALQAFAAVGSTDVALCAEWLVSRLPGQLPTRPRIARRGSTGASAYDLRSWTAGDSLSWAGNSSEGLGGDGVSGSPASESRRLARAVRRAGMAAVAPGVRGAVTPEIGGFPPVPPIAARVEGGGAGRGRANDMRTWAARNSVGGGVLARAVSLPMPRRSQSVGVRLPGSVDGEECCVCMDAPVQTRLVPCAHDCLCQQCAQHIVEHAGMCPLCRSETSGFIVVPNR